MDRAVRQKTCKWRDGETEGGEQGRGDGAKRRQRERETEGVKKGGRGREGVRNLGRGRGRKERSR